MRMIPGMTILSPADAIETRQAIRAAYAHQGPVYVRSPATSSPASTRKTTASSSARPW